jgi:hypothetical protein
MVQPFSWTFSERPCAAGPAKADASPVAARLHDGDEKEADVLDKNTM